MSQPIFGTGLLALTSNLSGVQTPIQVAVLQDVSLDIDFKTIDLVGNLQFPVDKAKGQGSAKGKFKTGYFAGGLVNAILSGSTVVAGSLVSIANESHTIPTTPYQVVTAQGALTAQDLGVFDTILNKFDTCVSSGPTTGQYTVTLATGTYTFAAADTTHVVQISYLYTASSTGTTIALTNQMMGTNTTFSLRLFNNYSAAQGGANQASNFGIYLPVVTIPKLSFPFKNTGFMVNDVDFELSASAAGSILSIYTGN